MIKLESRTAELIPEALKCMGRDAEFILIVDIGVKFERVHRKETEKQKVL